MIGSVVIGVPAQNEARRVGASIASLLAAAAALEPHVDVHITVGADGCTDDTEAIVQQFALTHPQVSLIHGQWGSAGGTRRAAIAHALGAAVSDAVGTRQVVEPADTAPPGRTVGLLEDVWIATTDADTVVPNDWLIRQIGYAQLGFDAVAGVVDLIHDDDVTALIIERFTELYRLDEIVSHTHVHGANLGIRATAYLAAGGFPEVVCSEDHALWNELRRLGFACVSPVDVRVLTSARLRSRAPGGFADTLAAFIAAQGRSVAPTAQRAVA